MLLVRNNVVVSVGKPGQARTNANRLGFTLLTYNCLAEIYVSPPTARTPRATSGSSSTHAAAASPLRTPSPVV